MKKIFFLLLLLVSPNISSAFTIFEQGVSTMTVTFESDGVTPFFIRTTTKRIANATNQTLTTSVQYRVNGGSYSTLDSVQSVLSDSGEATMHNPFYYGTLPEGDIEIRFFTQNGTTGGFADMFVSSTIGNVDALSFDGFWLFFSFIIFIIGFLIGSQIFKRK